jgi:hypothetical protein
MRAEEDLSTIENSGFLMIPDVCFPDYLQIESTTYIPKPYDFFNGALNEVLGDHEGTMKSSKNRGGVSAYMPFVKSVGP